MLIIIKLTHGHRNNLIYMEYLFQFRRDGTEGGMILAIEKLIRHKGKVKSQKVIKETA